MAKKKTEAEIEATPEQGHFDGMAPEKNRKVHAAARRYVARRNERIAANAEEKDAHDSLLIAMHDEGLTNYVYDDIEVHIDAHEKCKVKCGGDKSESDDE